MARSSSDDHRYPMNQLSSTLSTRSAFSLFFFSCISSAGTAWLRTTACLKSNSMFADHRLTLHGDEDGIFRSGPRSEPSLGLGLRGRKVRFFWPVPLDHKNSLYSSIFVCKSRAQDETTLCSFVTTMFTFGFFSLSLVLLLRCLVSAQTQTACLNTLAYYNPTLRTGCNNASTSHRERAYISW